MTITATSLPIRAYGYPPVEWDATIERFNVLPPDSLVEPVGGWGRCASRSVPCGR